MIKKFVNPVIKKYHKLSRRKKAVVIVLVLILGIVGYIQWRKVTKSPEHTLEAAKFDSLIEVVSESGNVTAAGVTPIYSTTTGMVEEVFVKNGDLVSENDILFKVKSTATKQEQDAALSDYLTAKNALESAKATQLSLQATMFTKWDTFKELAESDDFENEDGTPKYINRALPEFHIPEKEWLTAESDYKNQQQVISQKSAEVSETWRAYQATQNSEVEAIFAGEVRNLGIAKGDLVKVPTALTLASTPVSLVLVDNDVATIIKLSVNETDAVKVKEGQSANVEFDAIPGTTFSAIVDRVDTVASSSDVVSFSVYIALDEKSNLIMRGMTADVDITVARKGNVLTVPSSAVKPYQGGKAVRVIGDDGEIEFVPVKVGSRGDGKIEIISGIDEGTLVIVAFSNDQIERKGGLF